MLNFNNIIGRGFCLLAAFAIWTGQAAANSVPPAGEEGISDTMILLLVGGFVLALIIFVWIASITRKPDRPLEDDSPFYPLDIDDDK